MMLCLAYRDALTLADSLYQAIHIKTLGFARLLGRQQQTDLLRQLSSNILGFTAIQALSKRAQRCPCGAHGILKVVELGAVLDFAQKIMKIA
jgi:hypothetical protein